jgi:hypothetical protein
MGDLIKVAWRGVLLSATVAAALAPTAFAGVDIQNGVLDTPNAYVMENTQFNIGVSSFALTSGTTNFYTHEGEPFEKSLRELDAFFSFGLLDRVEVGVREYDPETYSGDVKVLIKKESARWPAFSAGIFNLGAPHDANPYGAKACWYADDDRQNNAYYLVASKNMRNIIRVPMTVNLGVGSARFQGTNPDWPHSRPWQGMFGSVEYHFNDEKISLIGELDGRDLNIGARFKLPWGFVITPYVSELEEAWWGRHSTTTLTGIPYEDEYDSPKGGIAVQLYVGPLYSRAETERVRALRSRLKRAEERLKQARQRRELLERRVEEIREELLGP